MVKDIIDIIDYVTTALVVYYIYDFINAMVRNIMICACANHMP